MVGGRWWVVGGRWWVANGRGMAPLPWWKTNSIQPSQVKSSQVKSSQVKPNRAKWSQVEPSRAKSSQVLMYLVGDSDDGGGHHACKEDVPERDRQRQANGHPSIISEEHRA